MFHALAPLYGKERNFTGEQLLARGHAVSTVGIELDKSANTSANGKMRMERVDTLKSVNKAPPARHPN